MMTAHQHLMSFALSFALLPAIPFAGAAVLTEARVRDYYAAWSSGNVDEVMTYFTPDAVYEDVATAELATGAAQVGTFASKFLQSSPGVKVEPTNVVIGDHSAAVEWTMGAGAGKDAWTVRGAAILQHRDGQITRATDYWNSK